MSKFATIDATSSRNELTKSLRINLSLRGFFGISQNFFLHNNLWTCGIRLVEGFGAIPSSLSLSSRGSPNIATSGWSIVTSSFPAFFFSHHPRGLRTHHAWPWEARQYLSICLSLALCGYPCMGDIAKPLHLASGITDLGHHLFTDLFCYQQSGPPTQIACLSWFPHFCLLHEWLFCHVRLMLCSFF